MNIKEDIVKKVYDKDPEQFETWLTEVISKYIDNSQGYISLDAFLLSYGAFELPTQTANDFYIVKYLKHIEKEHLKATAAKIPALAYNMLTEKEEGTQKLNIAVSFESAVKKEAAKEEE